MTLLIAQVASISKQAVTAGDSSSRLGVASILKRAVTAGDSSSRLGVIWGLPPLSLVNMLHVIGGGFSS